MGRGNRSSPRCYGGADISVSQLLESAQILDSIHRASGSAGANGDCHEANRRKLEIPGTFDIWDQRLRRGLSEHLLDDLLAAFTKG